MISGTFIDHRDTGRPEIHPSPVMSGANARSQNLPGSFNGFLAETGNSETDPKMDIRALLRSTSKLSIVYADHV